MAALVLLWPMLVLTEFKPWLLVDPASLNPTLHFLGDFLPPKFDLPFLALVARETWRTVAMATAGLVLALLLAVPMALLSVRALSVSALSGRMALGPAALRQAVRWTLVLLRSVPELIWALVFVRVVGLGPTAGVLGRSARTTRDPRAIRRRSGEGSPRSRTSWIASRFGWRTAAMARASRARRRTGSRRPRNRASSRARSRSIS